MSDTYDHSNEDLDHSEIGRRKFITAGLGVGAHIRNRQTLPMNQEKDS